MISSLLRSIARALRFALRSIGKAIQAYIRHLQGAAPTTRISSYPILNSTSDLAASRLVFAEQSFVIRRPVKLAVRVDRVYDDGKSLILLELKTRAAQKIYQTDVIELSAQRVALSYSTNRKVASFGYVLVIHPLFRRQSLHRVELAPESTVIALADRRQQLLAGQAKPVAPHGTAKCSKCEYRPECGLTATNSSAKPGQT